MRMRSYHDVAGWMALLADGYALEIDKDGPLWRAAQARYHGHGLAVMPLSGRRWVIYLSAHRCRPALTRLLHHACYERHGRVVLSAGATP